MEADGARADLVLVRVAACNRRDALFTVSRPDVPGSMSGGCEHPRGRLEIEFAGVVESVSRNLGVFEPCDEVYGIGHGAFADYLCAAASEIARKPSSLDFETAATVPFAGLAALQGLRDCARLRPAERVFVVGADGAIGRWAVQIAKHMGARVTPVRGMPRPGRVRASGDDEVGDAGDPDAVVRHATYDVILVAGRADPEQWLRALTRGGRLVLAGGDAERTWLAFPGRTAGDTEAAPPEGAAVATLRVRRSGADLGTLASLIDGGVLRP